MTRCGDANEKISAGVHGLLVVLYVIMGVFHLRSTLEHWRRHRAEEKALSS